MYLAATNLLRAKAGTAAVINYAIFTDEVTTTDAFSPSAAGQLGSSIATVYTTPSATQTLITEIQLANTSASPVTGVIFYMTTGAVTNHQLNGGFTIPANGTATYKKDNTWLIADSTGATVAQVIALTGDVTGSGSGTIATTLATVNASPGTTGSASKTNTITVNGKGLVTANTEQNIAITNTQVSGLGTSSTKNTGISVVDPGTGALESVVPIQAQISTTSKTYTTSDLQKWFSRTNGGVAMTDTLPVMSAARDGEYIIIANDDTTATNVISAGAGQAFVNATGTTGASTFTMYPSRRTQFVWNNTGGFWRLFSNNNNLTKGKSGTTFTLGNIPIISTNTNGNEIDDSGIAPSALVQTSRTISTTAPITGGGALSSNLTLALTTSPAGQTPVGVTRTLTATAPITIDGGTSADLSANRTLAVSDATFTTRGTLTATEKIALNTMDGRDSTGANKRVFRPGDYMTGNVYDPTGSSTSTAFTAMMTAARAWNDRYEIELEAGVWKIPFDTFKDFGTNNTSVTIHGPGRGNCILLPSAAPTGFQSMITPNRNTTGGDSITMRGFTIYNTSGTVYTAGSGILTNGADAIDIQEVAFIDMYRDIQVSGEPHTMVTNGTTSLTGITPAISAADTGQTISGPGIIPGSTITFLTSSTATLSVAATTSTTEVRYLNSSIKVSMQHIVSFNSNAGAANTSVGIYVNNGQAGDTYIGPDFVVSDGGGSTRRRACIELVETGHYEITQCNLTGSQVGILADPGASQSVAFGFHTNVLCDSNTVNGMVLDTLATTASVKNIKSVNSWYSGTVNGGAPFNTGAAGVITKATAAGTLNGITHTTDRFLNNRTHGYQHGAGTDFRWSDCDMKGNSQIGSGTADGLNVAANIGNWSINGGKYGGTDASPTGSNQGYGINVAAGTGDNIKVGPDSLTGNVTGPLSFGATGANNFINGCPGLAPNLTRGSATGAITTAEVVVASITIPKNSVRVGTTINIVGQGIISNTTTQSTWTSRVRMGTTSLNTPIVGSDVQTSGIVARTNFSIMIIGNVTFYSIGAGGTALGHFQLIGGVGSGGVVTTGNTALTAAVTVDTTADRLCEFTIIGVTGTPSITIHNATVTVNY